MTPSREPSVRVNLIGKVRQEIIVGRATITPSSAPCQLAAGRRASEMVVEIDRQQHFTEIVGHPITERPPSRES